jgi:tetratricopeptide (TPR) repeat protein
MLERARLLLHQHRPEETEQMVRGHLVENPDDPNGHLLLAQCLNLQDRPDQALRVIDQAIRLAPHWAQVYFVKGAILIDLNKFNGALACAEEAIALDPEDPNYYGLLGQTLALQKKWRPAIEQLRLGLALDPEHGQCRNLLSHCLSQTGDKGLARKSLDTGLAQNPLDPYAHIQVGFDSLKHGDSGRALQAFEEALRLDPGNEAARDGLVEALKARNPIYGLLLRGFIRLSSLPERTVFLMLVGFFVLNRIARNLRGTHPEWEWFLQPFNWFYLGVVAISWFADSFFDLLLLGHRRGRNALIGQSRRKAILFGISLSLVCICFGFYFLSGNDEWLWAGLFTLIGQIPVVAAFASRKGGPRLTMAGIAYLCNGLIALGFLIQLYSFQIERVEGMNSILTGGVIAALSSWLGIILMAFQSSAD